MASSTLITHCPYNSVRTATLSILVAVLRESKLRATTSSAASLRQAIEASHALITCSACDPWLALALPCELVAHRADRPIGVTAAICGGESRDVVNNACTYTRIHTHTHTHTQVASYG